MDYTIGDTRVDPGLTQMFKSAFAARDFSAGDILLFVAIIGAIALIIYIYIRDRNSRRKKLLERQYLTFKLSQMGLSAYEMGILDSMAKISGKNALPRFFKNSSAYENAITSFILYSRRVEKDLAALLTIAKEIVRIHSKIYPLIYDFGTEIKPAALPIGIIACIIYNENESRIVKLISKTEKRIIYKVLGSMPVRPASSDFFPAKVLFYSRDGAEFSYATKNLILDAQMKEAETEIPEAFEITAPEHVGLFNVSIESKLTTSGAENETKEIPCIILRINPEEAFIRTQEELEASKHYSISFEVENFAIQSSLRILSSRTLEPGKVFYYSAGLESISQAGKGIIQSLALKGKGVK